MARTAGIPLVDLFGLTDQINAALPPVFQGFTDRFVATRHRTTRSAGAIHHHGVLQSVLDSASVDIEELDIGIGTLQIPLIHSGLPFQLAIARAPITGNLEPAPASWQLDIRLADFILTLDALEPAIYRPESSTAPRHLVRDPGRDRVKIIGSATVRFSRTGSADIVTSFIDESDPLDPSAASGGVLSLTCSPPHFFFGKSQLGMTINQLAYDFSDDYSPPGVIERGQGAAWEGLSVKEATLYAPRNLPLVGDVSGSVKNALFGRPAGIQGDFELQFGRSALSPDTFRFRQDGEEAVTAQGQGLSRKVAIVADQDDRVTVQAAFTASSPPDGGVLEDWSARWHWPDGSMDDDVDVSSGAVMHGEELRVTPLEHIDGVDNPIEHPEIIFRFEAAGEGAVVRTRINGNTLDNVVHIGGTVAQINALTLEAVSTAPGTSSFEWELSAGNVRHKGAVFTPDVTGLSGEQLIKLNEKPEDGDPKRVSHLMVRIVEEGELLVGTEGGVFTEADSVTAQPLSDVEATYDLSDFHASGATRSKAEQAELDDTTAANVVVPADGLAQVVIPLGAAPAQVEHDRHISVLMAFDDNVVLGWGKDDDERSLAPVSANGGNNEATIRPQVQDWAARYPGAQFIVIGRCDDIGSDAYNEGLAQRRASKGVELLTGVDPTATAVEASRVYLRGEQSSWSNPAGASGDGNTLEEDSEISLDEAEKSEAVGNATLENGRLIEVREDRSGWPADHDVDHAVEKTRVQYRRVDIYAVGGTPGDDSVRAEKEPARDPTYRRSLVPANGRVLVPTHAPDPRFDYRVRLLLGWDKPTADGFDKAVPNLGELDIVWTPAETPLPDLDRPGGGTTPVDMSSETWIVELRFIHDEITDFTRVSLGLRSEGDVDGLGSVQNSLFTSTMALAPMLLSGINPEDDAVGAGARITALVALAGLSQADLGSGKKLISDESKTALIAVRGEVDMRSSADPGAACQLKVLVEYTCTLHVDFGRLGLRTDEDRPLKIRYKDVGITFDNTRDAWEKLGLAYDTRSLEIEDPGVWQIDGVLGQLLRVVEVEMGNGSLWIEARLAIGLNLGIINVTEAIVRMTFNEDPLPVFELRGFVLTASIPGVLEGEGRLRIEDSGVIRAGVEAMILPVGLGCTAGLAFGKPFGDPPGSLPDIFLELFLGVQFSTPVPLGQSGAALYGFKGLFVMNGERDIADDPPDRVQAELDWWNQSPGEKYRPELGQYALGVGIVLGTMPDASFCFSASGMLVVAFPDPEVILGVDVEIISVPDTQASDGRKQSSTITGLIVIDDEAVTVAVSATYDIPALLSLKVPFGAYFPYSLQGTYVRIGSDGFAGRVGEAVTLTLLPGTLDAKAWAYLMIEQDGLPSLGGDPRFSFDGFSVGMGAGWSLEWSAGPIELRASAKVLVGFGTRPLLIKGGVFVDGELDLVVVSISARGEIILTYLDGDVFLDGEFCGSVDLFFFSLEGCVDFKFGATLLPDEPPEPAAPIVSIDLTDRQDRIMGAATTASTIAALPIFDLVTDAEGNTRNDGVPPGENNTVWGDTAPVLNFRQHALMGMSAGDRIAPCPSGGSSLWSGSNRLKYAYRIDQIVLKKRGGADVGDPSLAIQTVWMSSPVKLPDSSGVNNAASSEHEGPRLKLLDWDPWTWVENTESGGAGTRGDPVDEIDDLCDPLPQPRRACVYGRAARGVSLYQVRFRAEKPALPPYPSKFFISAEPALTVGDRRFAGAGLQTLLASRGVVVHPGVVVDLPMNLSLRGEVVKRGYRLPYGRQTTAQGLRDTSLPWEGRFDRQVVQPELVFLICEFAGQAGDTRIECFDFDGVRPDGKHLNLVLEPLTIRALDQQRPFAAVDRVDSLDTPVSLGSDGRADISFPSTGIEIFLRQACVQVELFFWKPSSSPIEISAVDTTGAVADTASITVSPNGPISARLTGAAGIVRLRIKGGSGESLLFRICCTVTDDPELPSRCETFKGVKLRTDEFQSLTHNGIRLEVLNPRTRMRMTDRVDQTGSVPRVGNDRSPEFLFPSTGMSISLPKGCRKIELWVMLGASEVVASGVDGQGKEVARVRSSSKQGVPLKLTLASSGDAIVQISLLGGSGEGMFFRLCCLDRAAQERCIDFKGLKLADAVSSFSHGKIAFSDLGEQNGLRLVDLVDVTRAEPSAGSDGVPELLVPRGGLGIKLPEAADTVLIRAMTFGGLIKAEARNARGARVDGAVSSNKKGVEHELRLSGPEIVQVELFSEAEDSVIHEICMSVGESEGDGSSPDDLDGLPIVFGRPGRDERGDRWPGRILSSHKLSDGRHCHVVAYAAQEQGRPYDAFDLVSPNGWEVSFLSACAVDRVAVENRQDDQRLRDERISVLTSVLQAEVTERRDIILEADTVYDIEIGWSWQAWEGNDDGSYSPPAVSATDDWQPAQELQVFSFATAGDTLGIGQMQDGVNEHVFDARDMARYINLVEPVDGRAIHFTGDPLWVHFSEGHVSQLAELYGYELAIEVRRTDPPPQVTRALLIDKMAPLPVITSWHAGPTDFDSRGATRINKALLEAPCLPDGSATGGASMAATVELEPLAMYDLNLVARDKDSDLSILISGTRFTTSRYEGPQQMLADLGYDAAGEAPFPAREILVTGPPRDLSGAFEESDTALGELLAQFDADTLPLPTDRPNSHVVWRFDGADWVIDGVLVDSLEPMKREGAVVTASGSEIVTRLLLAQGAIGTESLEVYRANTQWTRVFLTPASPIKPVGETRLELTFSTPDGELSGSRVLGSLPRMLALEGLV